MRLRHRHRGRAAAAGHRRDDGRPARGPHEDLRLDQQDDRPQRSRVTSGSDADVDQAFARALPVLARSCRWTERDKPAQDIVTTLLNASIDDDKLSEIEFDMFFLLLVGRRQRDHAQLDEPRHARRSCQHPDQWEKFKSDPDRHMARRARRDPAVGDAGAALPAHGAAGLRARRRQASKRATSSSSGTSRPTATSAASTIRSASTSSATPTNTSRSAAAVRTSVSAPTSPAWSCG